MFSSFSLSAEESRKSKGWGGKGAWVGRGEGKCSE